jgi:hypothetical protein
MTSSPRVTPAVRAVAIFTLSYLAIAAPWAILSGNMEFVLYIGVTIVLVAIVGFVHFRVGLRPGVLWGMSIWGLLHMAGGLWHVPASWPIKGDSHVLYNVWVIPGLPGTIKYDQVVHFFGFGVTTWLCWEGLRGALARSLAPGAVVRPTFGLMVLIAAAGMGFGALNEVIEFAVTMLTPTNVGGYVNTGWDLVSNLAGAVTAAFLISRTERRRVALPAV